MKKGANVFTFGKLSQITAQLQHYAGSFDLSGIFSGHLKSSLEISEGGIKNKGKMVNWGEIETFNYGINPINGAQNYMFICRDRGGKPPAFKKKPDNARNRTSSGMKSVGSMRYDVVYIYMPKA